MGWLFSCREKNIKNGIFVFFVIISGWIGVLVDSVLIAQPEGDSLGMGIWLVLPLLTAFIIILFSKDIGKDTIMRLCKMRKQPFIG